MGAFITNFQSPVELDDLKDRLDCGGITNLDMILHPEKFSPIEWTVDKEAKIGDVVVFMCAKTSVNHIAHLCKQLKDGGGGASELSIFAESQKQNYKRFAGSVVALGRVAEEPFQTEISGWRTPYWRSPWYAKVDEIHVLRCPVFIEQFRNFISVSRTGAITKLTDEQWAMLKEVITIEN